MPKFEYRVVPAPAKGEKAKGLKTTQDRFARTLTGLMNRMGAEGWEYLRAETLPCEERSGFTGTKMGFQHMLIFRRALMAGPQDMALPAEPNVEKPRKQPPAPVPEPIVTEPPPKPRPAPVLTALRPTAKGTDEGAAS